MTEEIFVDGVNVAGCCYLFKFKGFDDFNEEYTEWSCNISGSSCENSDNCYYKQLKRLEQENKKLKKDVQLFKCLDTFGENECHCACRCLGNEFCEDADKKINSYRSALEEIKAMLGYGYIVDKINEVLGC